MEKAKTTKTRAHHTETTTTVTAGHEPRNFLAAFLLVLSFGPMGLNRLYTGEKTIGWIRFGLFFGGLLLSAFFVGEPLMLVAVIWGIVDVFLVYNGTRTDAAGAKLTATTRDLRLAKILYIIFIVVLVLSVIAFIILASILGNAIMNGDFNFDRPPHNYPLPERFPTQSY